MSAVEILFCAEECIASIEAEHPGAVDKHSLLIKTVREIRAKFLGGAR